MSGWGDNSKKILRERARHTNAHIRIHKKTWWHSRLSALRCEMFCSCGKKSEAQRCCGSMLPLNTCGLTCKNLFNKTTLWKSMSFKSPVMNCTWKSSGSGVEMRSGGEQIFFSWNRVWYFNLFYIFYVIYSAVEYYAVGLIVRAIVWALCEGNPYV